MVIMRLNLKECEHRKFNKTTGEIFCKKEELFVSVEDCLDCMINNENCE